MTIRIASCNFWGLPWPFSVHKHRRLGDLIAFIQQQNLDVIALQEVWMNWDVNKIKKSLPDYHVFEKHDIGFNPSGLVTLSRFPLEDGLYVPFDNTIFHLEFPAQKGIYRTVADINGKKIFLLNTHVYYSPKTYKTKNQKKHLDQLIAALDTEPTLLFGDFNVHYNELELPPHFHLISNPHELTYDKTTYYATKRFNRINGQSRTPDMIFANFDAKIVSTAVIKKPLLSDHYPTIVELEI